MIEQDSVEDIVIKISEIDKKSLQDKGACRIHWPSWKGDPPEECILETYDETYSVRVRLSIRKGNSESEKIYEVE